MAYWPNQVRQLINPGPSYREPGRGTPRRASIIILGMTLVMVAVALLAKALTELFAAA